MAGSERACPRPRPAAQGALREGAKQMTFMDKVVEVDRNAGIFVTLNPAGKGYGGRSKLPDNLKQLFRCAGLVALSGPRGGLRGPIA